MEDFWLIVAFQSSEDETESRNTEIIGGEGHQGYRPGDPQALWRGGKIRIVLDGLRGEDSIAALCRREGIAESLLCGLDKSPQLLREGPTK